MTLFVSYIVTVVLCLAVGAAVGLVMACKGLHDCDIETFFHLMRAARTDITKITLKENLDSDITIVEVTFNDDDDDYVCDCDCCCHDDDDDDAAWFDDCTDRMEGHRTCESCADREHCTTGRELHGKEEEDEADFDGCVGYEEGVETCADCPERDRCATGREEVDPPVLVDEEESADNED